MAARLLVNFRASLKFKPVRSFGIKATVSSENENLEISSDSCVRQFPFLWLRDNCRCANCFNADIKSRIVNWEKFNVDVKIQNVTTNGNAIEIIWDDNHRSVFNYEWLRERSFAKEDQEEFLKKNLNFSKQLWNKDNFDSFLKTFEYSQIMKNDHVLYDYLTALSKTGIVLLDNVPDSETKIQNVVGRIGFSRTTHYGETYLVTSKKNPTHVAYLPSALQLHVDLSCNKYKPGITVLHYVQQAEDGGQNLFTDGFYVAEKLRRERKDIFDILTDTNVLWSDKGVENNEEFHKISQSPTICLDSKGNIVDINHNVLKRTSHFVTDIKNVNQWYKALKIFLDECYNSAVDFKVKKGQILMFDNSRLLHGRRSYQDAQNNSRLLVGAYMDWDEVYSKFRVLRNKLNVVD